MVRTATPEYWDDACKHLARRDRVMRKLISRSADGRLESRGDAFTTLARSVVGQQISVRAAQTVWDRLTAIVDGGASTLVPSAVLALDTPTLRSAGLSARKVEYLTDLARHFESGTVHVAQWRKMDDEAIVDELVAIRGIGRWTAEMFLMFGLVRPDVWPIGDLGIRAAIKKLDKLPEMPVKSYMIERGNVFAPYRTVASWYLWQSLTL